MTGMTPLVRAKVDSIAGGWLAFLPHVWLAYAAGLSSNAWSPASSNARREQLPETPDITKHMAF